MQLHASNEWSTMIVMLNVVFTSVLSSPAANMFVANDSGGGMPASSVANSETYDSGTQTTDSYTNELGTTRRIINDANSLPIRTRMALATTRVPPTEVTTYRTVLPTLAKCLAYAHHTEAVEGREKYFQVFEFCKRCAREQFRTNECDFTRCQSEHGVFDFDSVGKCVCIPGRYGAHCAAEIPDCANEGEWDQITERCVCAPAWIGKRCEAEYCLHGGLYHNRQCHCTGHWNGTRCELIVCLNQGYPDQQTMNKCYCGLHFKGTHCEDVAIVLPSLFWEISGGLVLVGGLWTLIAAFALFMEYRCTGGHFSNAKTYKRVNVNGEYAEPCAVDAV